MTVEIPENLEELVEAAMREESVFTTFDLDQATATIMLAWNPDELAGTVAAVAQRLSGEFYAKWRMEDCTLIDTGERGVRPERKGARAPIYWRLAGTRQMPRAYYAEPAQHFDYAVDIIPCPDCGATNMLCNCGYAPSDEFEPRTRYHLITKWNSNIRANRSIK